MASFYVMFAMTSFEDVANNKYYGFGVVVAYDVASFLRL